MNNKKYRKIKYLLMLIIIVVLIFSVLQNNYKKDDHLYITRDIECGTICMPIEEYMLGVMAAVVDPTCELECQKALAVLIRGNLVIKNETSVVISDNSLYFDYAKRKDIFNENQEEYESKLKQAIKETSGIVAISGNQIMKGDYHALSAGMTRAGVGNAKQTNCSTSMEVEDFFTQMEFTKDEIGSIAINEKDEAGYVVTVNWNQKSYSGDYFRYKFNLPSSNFDIREEEAKWLITCRGKGHGIGMDLYYANELAKQGMKYNEILYVFFQNFNFTRIIV